MSRQGLEGIRPLIQKVTDLRMALSLFDNQFPIPSRFLEATTTLRELEENLFHLFLKAKRDSGGRLYMDIEEVTNGTSKHEEKESG